MSKAAERSRNKDRIESLGAASVEVVHDFNDGSFAEMHGEEAGFQGIK